MKHPIGLRRTIDSFIFEHFPPINSDCSCSASGRTIFVTGILGWPEGDGRFIIGRLGRVEGFCLPCGFQEENLFLQSLECGENGYGREWRNWQTRET